jgi:hypothetical protein
MDRLGKFRAIVSACRDANPDVAKRFEPDATLVQQAAQIRRSDIVAALLLDRSSSRCARNLADFDHWWNLRSDQLSSQSDECIGFAYQRLMSRDLPFGFF